ncbi:MAG TPA: hypothetical protein ENI52_04005 [Thermoplasmata archaeon]|nr:hypothetical protein [Thermoplasmata archaeon]
MAAISGANLKTILDSVAKQKQILDAAVGDTTTNDTILYGMQQNADRIGGYSEDIKKALFKIAVVIKDSMEAFKLNLDHALLRAIDSHIREEEGKGLSDYWEAENYPTYRIAPEVAQIARAIGLYLKASICFPPVIVMGTFAVTGAGAGTFTDGNSIDGNLYGPADCELEITAKGGASVTLTATITGTDENGAEVTGTASFSSADVGDKVDVSPDQSGKKFQDITDITISGGVDGDAFKIQSKVDRTVTL